MIRHMMALILATGLIQAAAVSLPDATVDMDKGSTKGKQTLVLAGGCFWCTEAVFEQLNGVDKVVSGYAGGDAATAHYEIVGSGHTNHAESIEVTYDPSKISMGQILKVFFAVAHDPTTLNRQGPDWGKQYRSAIFYKDAEQKKIAEAYIKQLEDAHAFGKPIVTEVTQLKKFYSAEGYHQHYVQLHPDNPYVMQNSVPKLEKLKKQFGPWLKK